MSVSPSSDSRSIRAARQARAALSRASRRAVVAAAVALGATFLMGNHAFAAPAVGQQAPDFVAVDTSGAKHKLSDFAGKFVVLEWTNPGCPFVRKHYNSGNMPATQKSATAQGVVWLSVNSTERAASDYLQPAALDAWMPEALAYKGQRDPKGMLVYAGGIDSIASARPDDIKSATNYVNQALGEAFGGKPISAASTRPYGCSVKYKS